MLRNALLVVATSSLANGDLAVDDGRKQSHCMAGLSISFAIVATCPGVGIPFGDLSRLHQGVNDAAGPERLEGSRDRRRGPPTGFPSAGCQLYGPAWRPLFGAVPCRHVAHQPNAASGRDRSGDNQLLQ